MFLVRSSFLVLASLAASACAGSPLPLPNSLPRLDENAGVVFKVDVSSPLGGGHGTGTVISRSGHVLTAYHVIEGEDNISLTIDDDAYPWPVCYDAEVVGKDPDHDLAVLKIDRSFDHTAWIADLKELKMGLRVYSIGYPLDLGMAVWDGIISVRLFDIPIRDEHGLPNLKVRAITFSDMIVAAGMSGGAVFSEETGHVVGTVTGHIGTRALPRQTIIQPVSKIRYVLDRHRIPYNEPPKE